MYYPRIGSGITSFFYNFFQTLVYTAPAILIAISMHEFAHGYMSYRLGDMTPKLDGRLTLNPFKHLDVWGTMCLLVCGVGWAKPIRVNVRNYKNPRRDMILVAAAGPLMNFLLGFLFMLFYGIFEKMGVNGVIQHYLSYLCLYSSFINIGLGVFNLIPIPPLDGSNILGELVPSVERFYHKIRQYSVIILALLLLSGLLSEPMYYINGAIRRGMWDFVKTILKIGVAATTGNGTVI